MMFLIRVSSRHGAPLSRRAHLWKVPTAVNALTTRHMRLLRTRNEAGAVMLGAVLKANSPKGGDAKPPV